MGVKGTDYADRVERLLAAEDGPAPGSAILLTTQPSIFYFTGFTGEDSWALLGRGKTTLLTDGRFALQAEEQSPAARTLIRRGDMVDCLAEHLRGGRHRSVAFLREEVTVDLLGRLRGKTRPVRWVAVSRAAIFRQRQVKSADEVRRTERAVRAAQVGFRDFARWLKPGRSETEAAAWLDYCVRRAGADRAAFPTIVAAGPNGAKPHAEAGRDKVRAGRPIVVDFGARCDGYCSDLTRTVWLGRMTRQFRDIYKICLEAQLAGIAAVRSGVCVRDVDAAARGVIVKAGLGQYFVHSLGHGIGLEVHEAPAVSRLADTTLESGMIVTVEPGIYVPGVGGVRIEDDVLVAGPGARVLSDLPKAIDDVIW